MNKFKLENSETIEIRNGHLKIKSNHRTIEFTYNEVKSIDFKLEELESELFSAQLVINDNSSKEHFLLSFTNSDGTALKMDLEQLKRFIDLKLSY